MKGDTYRENLPLPLPPAVAQADAASAQAAGALAAAGTAGMHCACTGFRAALGRPLEPSRAVAAAEAVHDFLRRAKGSDETGGPPWGPPTSVPSPSGCTNATRQPLRIR